eukprot:4592311-Amphidinium_carterae.1
MISALEASGFFAKQKELLSGSLFDLLLSTLSSPTFHTVVLHCCISGLGLVRMVSFRTKSRTFWVEPTEIYNAATTSIRSPKST